MAFSKITYRQRRRRKAGETSVELRRGFWRQLRNPVTWRLVVSIGLFIYRVFRWVRWVHELFE